MQEKISRRATKESIHGQILRETHMIDHQGLIIVPATATRGLILISLFIIFSLTCDVINIMDDDNFVIALEDQIQISIVLV